MYFINFNVEEVLHAHKISIQNTPKKLHTPNIFYSSKPYLQLNIFILFYK